MDNRVKGYLFKSFSNISVSRCNSRVDPLKSLLTSNGSYSLVLNRRHAIIQDIAQSFL